MVIVVCFPWCFIKLELIRQGSVHHSLFEYKHHIFLVTVPLESQVSIRKDMYGSTVRPYSLSSGHLTILNPSETLLVRDRGGECLLFYRPVSLSNRVSVHGSLTGGIRRPDTGKRLLHNTGVCSGGV